MGYFRYKQITNEGKLVGGLIDLPFTNPMSAMTFLERKGGTVIFAQPVPHWLGAMLTLAARFIEKPVSREELAESMNNLSVMLKAGIPMLAALQDTLADHANPTMARVGKEVLMRIESGSSFSDALTAYKRVFPESVIFLARLGEESGTLDRTVKDAANHELRIYRIIKETKSALTYPAFMFVAIFGALAFWLYFVVPPMVGMFKSMRLDLPALTVFVIQASEYVTNHAQSLVVGVACTLVGLSMLIRKNRKARKIYHATMLRLPVIKTLLHTFNIAFIAEYFSMMVRSGVDILYSLDVLSHAITNEVYRERVAMVRASLLQGLSLRESFQNANIFPNFVIRMIGVGEQSGTLSDQLTYIAEEYQHRLTALVGIIGKSIEPIALAIGGGIFALMTAALFLPLYKMIGSIGVH